MVVVLWISVLAPLLAPGEARAANGDLLADTFDANTLGQKPAAWSGGAPPATSPAPNPYIAKATVEQLAGTAGRVFRMEKNGKSTATYQLTRTLGTTATAKTLLTFKFRAEQTDAVVYLPSPRSGSVAVLKLALYNGTIAYMKKDASAWTGLMPYASGEFYEVKIAMDAAADTFDLYVNGEVKLLQEPMNAGDLLTGMYIGLYKDSVGVVYFDDIQLYTYKAAASASLPQSSYALAAGDALPLQLQYTPVDATHQGAVWTTSNASVATVSASGVVTGVTYGTALITATPVEPLPPVSVTVNVYDVPVTGVTIAAPGSVIPAGSRLLLQPEVSPPGATNKQLTWGTVNPDVATVDRYGEVTGVGAGTTTVYAVSAGGVRGEAAVTVASRTVQHELYVSPQGSDTSGTGSLAAPFRTIARAQERVRELRGGMTGDIVVSLRGGVYTLDAPLSFGPDDSGANGHFVVYRSYPGEQATLSGGREITGWSLHDAATGIYKANVGTGFQTRQLFVDGVRAVRARSEAGLTNPVKTSTGYTSDDTALAAWSDAADLELVFNEIWTNPRASVESVTISGGKAQVKVEEPGWTAVSNRGMTSVTAPVYYENAYELLDQPGEWYYSGTEGMLYYKPRVWEQLSTATVIAPKLEKLLTIRGASASAPVRNLEFQGLAFTYTTWMRPSTSAGHSDAQNNYLRYPGTPDHLPDAAVTVQLANTVNFERNTFTKLGITALRMDDGVQNSRVRGNRFYDLSGGAVTVGEPNSSDRENYNPTDIRKVLKNNDIVNNWIHDIGVDYKSASAISAGYPVDMDISHNEMYSLPYSGTHVGYGWAKAFDPVTKNVYIQNNLIYDLMGKGLRDGGAIYSLGTTGATPQNKNIVSGNYLRNQMDASGVLYTDEASAYWRFENNVIDLKDTPPWHAAKRWALAWATTLHDLDFNNNYTTEAGYTNNGTDISFTNTHVVPDANWPSEALGIIANAGLSPAYSDLADGAVSRWSVKPVSLNTGASAAVQLTATNGKDATLGFGDSQMYYATADPAVATVDASGYVTGVAQGRTKLTISIVNQTVLRTLETDVFVGDTLSGIQLDGQIGNVVYAKEGSAQTLHALGRTLFGNTVEVEQPVFLSSNPTVASISAGGALTAHAAGVTVLTLKGEYMGSRKESHLLLKVWNGSTRDDYALRAEVGQPDNWYVNTTGGASKVSTSGDITIGAPGGHATYQGRRFQNELLDFKLQINGAGSWYALMFGNPDPEKSYSNGTTYLVTISQAALELQRFNEGARTVIYGNISGYTSLGGDAVANTMLPYGQEKRVQLGSFEEAGGVRLILKVDGVEVFNYLDTAANAIKGPGYFGLVARTGSLTIGRGADNAAPLAGVALEGTAPLTVGAQRQLTAKAVDASGAAVAVSAGVSFASSQPAVATVSAAGVVTGVSPGTTVISATYGAATGSYPVTVE